MLLGNQLHIHINDTNKFANRYTRDELKKAGYSLAFFDNSALSDLEFVASDGTENKHKQQKFISICKDRKIRPIISIEIIEELVKKLPVGPTFEDLQKRKITTLRVLKESGLLWLLPMGGARDLEYCNLQNSTPNFAHNFLHVFSQYPLCQVEDGNPYSKAYLCDKDLNYSFAPDKPTVIHNGDIEKWFKNEIIPVLPTIKEEHKEYEKSMDSGTGPKFLEYEPSIDYSPFIKIWNCLVDIENPKKPANERFDTLHATNALSYCDYLVTNDDGLLSRAEKIKKDLDLKASICNLNEFLKE